MVKGVEKRDREGKEANHVDGITVQHDNEGHTSGSTCNAGDMGSTPGLERSPGGGHGSPLQYPCLENPMGRGAWRAAVQGVIQSRTGLRD